MGLLALILFSPQAATATAEALSLARDQYIPLQEITRGMTGYGLTVFEGSRIDTFSVTVVGVQKAVRAAGSLIMVEVAGHDLARSNVAQGMSGSPIYLDGRLAGALAMGWGGALRPLAGVTPIEEMLTLPSDDRHTRPGARGLAGPASPPLEAMVEPLVAGRPDRQLAAGVFGQETGDFPAGRQPNLTGWPAPENLIIDLLQPLLPDGADSRGLGPENWIISPLARGARPAAAGSGAPARALAGGSACAVPLIMGDALLGAIGTVTWVQQDQVYMMGHPFMQRGPVNLPLATAEILTVFPSRQLSFKLGSIGPVVGAVHHDLRAGLSGRLGPAPDMIPVEVALDVQESAWSRTLQRRYSFQVVDDPQLTPTLVFWTLYNALLAESDDASLQNVAFEIVLELERSGATEELKLEGVNAGPGGVGGLAGDIMAPLSLLLNNPFEPVRIRSVSGKLHTRRPAVVASITGLTLAGAEVAAGQALRGRVELTATYESPLPVEVVLDLPPDLEPGEYRLAVASAAEMFALEAQRSPVRFQPRDLDGLLELLRAGRSAGTLAVVLFAPGTGVMVQGKELGRLPDRVARVIRNSDMQAGSTLADRVAHAENRTDWVLQGHAVMSITVNPAAQPAVQERRP
jgi:hypothetical protein